MIGQNTQKNLTRKIPYRPKHKEIPYKAKHKGNTPLGIKAKELAVKKYLKGQTTRQGKQKVIYPTGQNTRKIDGVGLVDNIPSTD